MIDSVIFFNKNTSKNKVVEKTTATPMAEVIMTRGKRLSPIVSEKKLISKLNIPKIILNILAHKIPVPNKDFSAYFLSIKVLLTTNPEKYFV
ncbi:MAG: hypothetical protein HEQ35_25420 [Gloeotrichia echinulata IR180]